MILKVLSYFTLNAFNKHLGVAKFLLKKTFEYFLFDINSSPGLTFML